MEIIKQLFDIASLFDRIDNLNTVRTTFENIASIELDYRRMDSSDFTPILDDIYKTSELICTGLYTNDKSFEYQELVKGINRIGNLIICEKYNHFSAIVNASKAAYIATLLKYGVNEITRFSSTIDISKLKLHPTVHPAISKIKSFRPEAYFYWYEISRILQTGLLE